MAEHRLIERMIALMEQEILSVSETGRVHSEFIDEAVDFIRTYADRIHHGKEEEILFRACAKKELKEEDMKMMKELIEEHKYGRQTVAELVQAGEAYKGERAATEAVGRKLKELTGFYPKHIRKEDEVFFLNSEKYFSEEELGKMLSDFREFDSSMIHEKYSAVIKSLEKK